MAIKEISPAEALQRAAQGARLIDARQRKGGDTQAELILSGVQILCINRSAAAHRQQQDQQSHQSTV